MTETYDEEDDSLKKEEKRAQYFFHCISGMNSRKLMRIYKCTGSFEKALEMEPHELRIRGAIKSDRDEAKTEEAFGEITQKLDGLKRRYAGDGELAEAIEEIETIARRIEYGE